MSTTYSARSYISALTSTQAAAIGTALVKNSSAAEKWDYDSTSTEDAGDLVIVPSDNPASGRWIRDNDYYATSAIIDGLDTSDSSSSSSTSDSEIERLQFKSWFEGK